jgi:GNAT superfamily N-acetyltransferase
MVAASLWHVYANEQTEEQLDETLAKPKPGEPGYRAELDPIYEHLKGNRREIMATRPFVYLDVLFTHPKHHRRGAGAMMIKWGVDLADEFGLEAYHESSVEARPLYERFGYKVLKAVEFPMADYGRPDLGVDVNCLMYREAQGPAKK